MKAKKSTGEIQEIDDGQAKDKGVKLGWVLRKVDGQPYSQKLLNDKIMSSHPYTVTFDVEKNMRFR